MTRIRACVLLFVFVAPLAHGDRYVTMYTDDSYSRKVKRRKLDCKIHRGKSKSLSLGFKLGIPFLLNVGPEVKFGSKADVDWNETSQELIRRYEELCDMHNKGLLTVSEFNSRYKDLEAFYDKVLNLKKEIIELVQSRADKAFDELDKEVGKEKEIEQVKKKVEGLSINIGSISKEVEGLAEPKTVPKNKMPKKRWWQKKEKKEGDC